MRNIKEPKTPKKVKIDLTGAAGEQGLAQVIWEAVGMPERGQESWSALREALLTGARLPKRLEVRGWSAFQQTYPQAAKQFWNLMNDYADQKGHPRSQFVDLEGASNVMLWVPELLLIASLPVEILSLIVIFFRDSWKLAAVALLLALALSLQVVTLASIAFLAQGRWNVSRRWKRLAQWRAGLSVLLFGAALVGLLLSRGITLAGGIAVASSAIVLTVNLIYTLVFLWRTR